MFNARRKRDFDRVFNGSEEGQRVLGELYKMCGYKSQIFSNDPGQTAFNAGKHRIAQGIASILNQSEEDIHRAIKIHEEAIITERKQK